jgi:hypothetical protein
VDADITERFPDVEIATPGMDGPDKTHVPTPKRDPLVLCRIIETFMMGTIQELYHMLLIQKTMVYYSTLSMLVLSEQMAMHLTGTNLHTRYLYETWS